MILEDEGIDECDAERRINGVIDSQGIKELFDGEDFDDDVGKHWRSSKALRTSWNQ